MPVRTALNHPGRRLATGCSPGRATRAGANGDKRPGFGSRAAAGLQDWPLARPKVVESLDAGGAAHRRGQAKTLLSGAAHPFALASTVFAASWEQLVNSNPEYGSNSTAFAQRVGAAALRQTSQAVLSDGVFASVFHQDPRYYRLADGTLGKRIFYAASRTFRSRTDSGEPVVNYALLFGHATAQALTLAYYPDLSQNGHVAVTGFAWSLVGSMLGNQYHEFWPDILQAILQRPPAGPKPAPVPAEPRKVSSY